MANFVILNNKGGVGKSMVSQQILATFNIKEFGSANLFEIDDENHDASDLKRSKIVSEQVSVGNSDDNLKHLWATHELLNSDDKTKIIDVGGNKTTNWFINAVATTPYIAEDNLDAIIIPVIDNNVSVKNAEKVYNRLMQQEKLGDVRKRIIFCLNNLNSAAYGGLADPNSADDKDALTRKLKIRYYNFFNLVNRANAQWFATINMDGIENLKVEFETTIFEIYENFDELDKDVINDSRHFFSVEAKNLDKKSEDYELRSNMLSSQSIGLGDVKNLFINRIRYAHSGIKAALNNIGRGVEPEKTKVKPKKQS